jgi:hypothetical protein
MLRARFLFALPLLVSILTAEDDKQACYHVSADPMKDVYAHSAFAHGLRHGYEQGFHEADVDFHLGYLERELKLDKIPKIEKFRKEFGNKKSFRRGFEYGYLGGYRDSFAGRKFLVPRELATPTTSGAFDAGVADGFKAVATSDSPVLECSNAKPGYCDGFQVGIRLAKDYEHGSRLSIASK